MFHHAALDLLKYDVTNFQALLAVCSVAYRSIFKHDANFLHDLTRHLLQGWGTAIWVRNHGWGHWLW